MSLHDCRNGKICLLIFSSERPPSCRDDSHPHLWRSWCGLPGVWGWAGPGEAAGRWKNTCRHCKCSSSRLAPHTHPELSRAEWSFCVETGECSLRLCDRWSPPRWHHPGLWASASRTLWQTAEAGSPTGPRSPEATERGSGGAGPGPDTPGD